jgi:hypothetical protein
MNDETANGDGEGSEYVTVLETTDTSLLPVIKSLLTAAQVPFVVDGEEVLGVLPVGGSGGTASTFGKGIAARVLVPVERREEAEELIKGTAKTDL